MKIKHIAINGEIRKNTCKYHREVEKIFDEDHLGPEGLCLDLYSSAYPYCLALLHGAKFSWMDDKNKVYAQCPIPNGTHFEVKRISFEEQVISEGVKKNLEVLIKITHVEKEGCPHKVGEIFEFSQGDHLSYICPAAFYNMYPSLKEFISTKERKICLSCPDNLTKITFEIENENNIYALKPKCKKIEK
jgi:uncharacterized repeat protein (TIGR04076 family)